jgi:hypothetical protein
MHISGDPGKDAGMNGKIFLEPFDLQQQFFCHHMPA